MNDELSELMLKLIELKRDREKVRKQFEAFSHQINDLNYQANTILDEEERVVMNFCTGCSETHKEPMCY